MSKKVVKESDIAARISKISSRLIADGNQSISSSVKRNRNKNITFNELSAHTDSRTNELTSNQVILESNPTLNRAIEILTGMITCPNGGSTVSLYYDATSNLMDDKYNKDATAIAGVLSDHFTNIVKLHNEVSDMVYQTLATEGAYITAFIPAKTVDKVFDSVALEAEMKNLSTLSTTKLVNNELPLISVLKDPNILTLPDTKRYVSELKATIGNESESKAQVNAARVMRKKRVYKETPMISAESAKVSDSVESMTPAIVKRLSTIATKPIIFKGNAHDPYGYIIALDEDGYPIEHKEEIDFDKDLRSMSGKNTKDAQIKKIANNFSNSKVNVSTVNSLDALQDRITEHLEREIFDAIGDGTYTDKYTLKDDTTFNTLMFHRVLKNQKTRLLFLPEHQVNYFCFDIDAYGVGRSLVSKTKAISNIYTILFYANFMGNLSNAIPHKEVVIDFDEADLDQNKTLEMVMDELIQSKVGNFDFNHRGPSDIIRNNAKFGMEFKLQNVDNGDLPAMNIEVNDKKRDNRQVDSSFLELLNKLITQKIGFSSSVVDDSYSPQFSSQVNQNNDITARQISKYISMVTDNLSDRVVKQTINDPVIMSKCLDAMGGDDKVNRLENVLANLTVSLPNADNSSINEKTEVIENNIGVIELIVETLFPDSTVDGVDNMSAEHMEGFRDMAKSYFIQDYLRKNSSYRGIVDKVRTTDGLKAILDGEGNYKDVVMEAFADYTEKVIIKDAILDKKLSDAEGDIDEKLAEEQRLKDEIDGATPEEDNADDSTTDPEDDVEEEESTTDPEDDVEEADDDGEVDDLGVPTIDVP